MQFIIFAYILTINHKILCDEESIRNKKTFRGTKKASVKEVLQFDDGKYHPEKEINYRPDFYEFKFDDGQYRPDASGQYKHRDVKYIHIEGPQGPSANKYIHIDSPYRHSSDNKYENGNYEHNNEKYVNGEDVRPNLRRNYANVNEKVTKITNTGNNRNRRINNGGVRRKVIRKNNRNNNNNNEDLENKNGEYDETNVNNFERNNNARNSQFPRPKFIKHDVSHQGSDNDESKKRFIIPHATNAPRKSEESFSVDDRSKSNGNNFAGGDKQFKSSNNLNQNIQSNTERSHNQDEEFSRVFADGSKRNRENHDLGDSNSGNDHNKQIFTQNVKSHADNNKYEDSTANYKNNFNYNPDNSGQYNHDNAGNYKHRDNKYEHVEDKYKHVDGPNDPKHNDGQYGDNPQKYYHDNSGNYKHLDNKYEHIENKYEHIDKSRQDYADSHKYEDNQNASNDQYAPEHNINRQRDSLNDNNKNKFNENKGQELNRSGNFANKNSDSRVSSGVSNTVNQQKSPNRFDRDDKENNDDKLNVTSGNKNFNKPEESDNSFLNQLRPPHNTEKVEDVPNSSQYNRYHSELNNRKHVTVVNNEDSVTADSTNLKKYYADDNKKSNNAKLDITKDNNNLGNSNNPNVVFIGYSSTRSPFDGIRVTPTISGRAGVEVIHPEINNNNKYESVTSRTVGTQNSQNNNNSKNNRASSRKFDKNEAISRSSNTKVNKHKDVKPNDSNTNANLKNELNDTNRTDFLKRLSKLEETKHEIGHTLKFISSAGDGVSFGIGKSNVISKTGGEKSGSILYRCKKESKDGYRFK